MSYKFRRLAASRFLTSRRNRSTSGFGTQLPDVQKFTLLFSVIFFFSFHLGLFADTGWCFYNSLKGISLIVGEYQVCICRRMVRVNEE